MAKKEKNDFTKKEEKEKNDFTKKVEDIFGESVDLDNGVEDLNLFDDVERIKTGIDELDNLTCGGYPKGRVVVLYGPDASGKTTLTLWAIAQAQRNGGRALFIDAERSF